MPVGILATLMFGSSSVSPKFGISMVYFENSLLCKHTLVPKSAERLRWRIFRSTIRIELGWFASGTMNVHVLRIRKTFESCSVSCAYVDTHQAYQARSARKDILAVPSIRKQLTHNNIVEAASCNPSRMCLTMIWPFCLQQCNCRHKRQPRTSFLSSAAQVSTADSYKKHAR